ncbi:MAG: 2-C-methyl-D-erythritol 2,4-cyclodiphosphate synthase [Clostridia bacterium]|nr:2-C-methyl-D-erythritol 2,4-cyclodiphosphate synthase [Clostridia bacterium]
MKISAIVLCAGSATRSKLNINKVLYELDGTTVLEKSLSVFSRALVDEIIVATSEKDQLEIEKIVSAYPNATVVLGGNTRTESVKLALKKVTGDIVLIHDGARPYITVDLVKRLISDTVEFGSAIAAIPSCDTLAIAKNGNILSTVRDGYYQIQTPQAFFTKDIVYAYSQIDENQTFTDDSAVYSAIIKQSHITLGDRTNIKLTYPEDFLPPTRVGVGWDLHTLAFGRKLILGGIEIPHDKGLLGHSDADVLTHAIMDALLSALSLRDIGYHFPDTDPKYKGANSIELLKEVLKLIREKGYEVSNISACIMAEKPKLLKFIPEISTNLAKVINISTDRVGITATTMEKIGVVGREEGIAVSAFCQVKKAL